MAELSKRDRMIDAAKTFDSNHGCGSIGRCEICMADFALQQTAHLEGENKKLRKAATAFYHGVLISIARDTVRRDIPLLRSLEDDLRNALGEPPHPEA